MSLSEEELVYAYHVLLKAFPEDVHIARPMVQMLQNRGDNKAARELAMKMARRMLAQGYSTYALAFITICEQLDHPDKDEIASMRSMAELTMSATEPEDAGELFELIEALSDFEAQDFLRQGTLVKVKAGEDVIKQGEISRKFYLVLEGEMRVHVLAHGGQDVGLNQLHKGEFFGELACVYHLPRTATITAAQDAVLLEFDGSMIKQLLESSPDVGFSFMGVVQRRMIVSMSYAHPLFVDIEDADRKWLSEEASLQEFQQGELLTCSDDMVYILAFGRALAIREVHGRQLECDMDVHSIYGKHDMLALPEHTKLVAQERSLVCEVPVRIFDTFFKAYSGFEQWVNKHVTDRNDCLGG